MIIGLILAGLFFITFYTMFNKENVGCIDGFFMIILGIILCGVLS